MNKFVTGLMLAAALSTPAYAAEQGGFVAIDLGGAYYSGANFGGLSSNVSFPNPSTFQFGGGYNFNQNVGVEAAFVGVSDSTVNSAFGIYETLKTSSFYVAAVGMLPLSPQFDLVGKLGFASTRIDYTSNFFASASASQTNVMYGLGAQFNLDRNWGIRAQYLYLGKVDFPAGTIFLNQPVSIGLSTFTIGGVYTF